MPAGATLHGRSGDPAVRLVERAYAALEADDVPAFLEHFAVDAQVHYPAEGSLPYGGIWRGHDGISRFLDLHEEAEEILDFRPIEMSADGETVYVLGFFRGQARASDQAWETRWVHRFDVGGGQIRRWEAFFDTAAAVAARQRPG